MLYIYDVRRLGLLSNAHCATYVRQQEIANYKINKTKAAAG